MTTNVLNVKTDRLRAYGTGCARLGDTVADLSSRLRRDGEIDSLTWYGGHLTTLLTLQQALDEIRDLYREVRWATSHRVGRIAVTLLNTGATLHTAADRYHATDQENADWLAP